MPRCIPTGVVARATLAIAGAVLAAGCGRIGFATERGAPDSMADARGTDAGGTDALGTDGAGTDAMSAIANVGNSVQGTNVNTGDALVLMPPAATSAGHLLVLGLSYCCAGGTRPSVTDNEGNTWQLAGSAIADDVNDYLVIFYAEDHGGGITAVTIAPGVQQFLSAIFSEYADVDLTAPLDGYTARAVTGTTGDSGPLTPSQPGDLLAVVGDDDQDFAVATAGSGFTLITPGIPATESTQQGVDMDYQIDDSTAAVDGILQWQVSYKLPVAMAAFKSL